MNDTIKTPTLTEVIAAGYRVDIKHRRRYRVAYIEAGSKKLKVETLLLEKWFVDIDPVPNELMELLSRGGVTEVTVTDPEFGLGFFASATCRDDEEYCKKSGIDKCLDRIIGLMLVCEYKKDNGFKLRLQC